MEFWEIACLVFWGTGSWKLIRNTSKRTEVDSDSKYPYAEIIGIYIGEVICWAIEVFWIANFLRLLLKYTS